MPAWTTRVLQAARAHRGWALLSLGLAIACACTVSQDVVVQAVIRGWNAVPGISALLELVRPFGRGEVAVLVALAVAASGRRRLAGQLLTALALSALITWLIKVGVGRVRPNTGAFSFVSGDTSCAFALVPLLARSWLSGCGVFALAAGVALSRVVLNYHWPADVLGGAAVGMCSGVLAAGIWPLRPWRWLVDRRTWLWLAAIAWTGAAIWAVVSPKTGLLRLFLLVWAPALLAWAIWPWLRLRLRRGWLPPLWSIAVGLGLALLLLSSTSSLWDRDEPRNALAASEMLANQSWLVPTFNGEPRLHKPILPYWLMTVALRTGLPADLACRLPAVLCMSLAVLLLGFSVRRLMPDIPQVAAVAMLALATSPLVLVSGSAATTDAALMLGIAATMWVLLQTLLDGPRFWHAGVAGLAIGWALLAKGPMALLVPGATVAVLGCCVWSVPGRGLVTWRTWLVLLGAVLIGSLLALAWFIPANAATDGAIWRVMIGDHLIKRGFEARESHGGKFWYYLPVLLIAFIAWLPALVIALRQSWPIRTSERLILVAWAVPVLVALSLFQTKLPHYVLPMLWPLAVLVAVAVLEADESAWWRWSRRVQGWLLGLVASALILAPTLAVVAQAMGILRAPLPLAALAAPALAGGLAFWLLRHATQCRRERLVGAVLLGMATVVCALALNAWRLEVYKPAPRIAAEIRARVPAGVPITTCGFDEPSLYAYLGPAYGPLTVINGADRLQAWATADGPGVAVALMPQVAAATVRYGDALPVAELVRIAGYNYSNGKVVDIVVLGRALPARSRVRTVGP
jgi:4-amino-4-deoxy-L-arabinose transferase-like glycosyltransferase/membrane-associated phospholipid phosphatase